MKTEQIIKTLRDFNDFLCEREEYPPIDPEGIINASIKRLQELELTVARYERVYDEATNAEVEQEYRKEIGQLAKERDEAREECVSFRDYYEEGNLLPWEEGSK